MQDQYLTTPAEGVESNSIDDNRIALSGFLGQNFDVLDDSGLQHLIVNDPVELRTMMKEEGPVTEVREDIAGNIAESNTFFDNHVELRGDSRRPTPGRSAGYVSGKRMANGVETESGSVLEIGDGSKEENAELTCGIRRDSVRKSCHSSDYPDKTLTELGLFELEFMARAKAGEMGCGFNVKSSDGVALCRLWVLLECRQ